VPLDLPNLDDLTWQQLAELGRAMIPGWAPAWTNHNAADPGITLVELFAYLSEMLMYRVNRISAANMWTFLRLINGPGWQPPRDLEGAKRNTLLELGHTRRAVTAWDFERLALAVNDAKDSEERVARAKAVFRRNLASDDPASAAADSPGHVSVIVVPEGGGDVEPSAKLLERVRKILEPARLLTTRVHVVKPRYIDFGVRITLVVPMSVQAEQVQKEAIKDLAEFFDPLLGGPRKTGWPFGRSLFVSEIYERLARLPGVKLLRGSIDPRTRRPMDELVLPPSEAGRRRLNQGGRLEAIHLDADELVRLQETDIAVVHESPIH